MGSVTPLRKDDSLYVFYINFTYASFIPFPSLNLSNPFTCFVTVYRGGKKRKEQKKEKEKERGRERERERERKERRGEETRGEERERRKELGGKKVV